MESFIHNIRNWNLIIFCLLSFSSFSQSRFYPKRDNNSNDYIILYRNNLAEEFRFTFNCEKNDTIYNLNKINSDSIFFTLKNNKTGEILNVHYIELRIKSITLNQNRVISTYLEFKNTLKIFQNFWKEDIKDRIIKINYIEFTYKDKLYRFYPENNLKYLYFSNCPVYSNNHLKLALKQSNAAFNYNQICRDCLIDTVIITSKDSTKHFSSDTIIYKRLKCGLYLSSDGNLFVNNYRNLDVKFNNYRRNNTSLISGDLYTSDLYDTISVDSNGIFTCEKKTKMIDFIDTNSFKFINDYYAFDKNHIFTINHETIYVLFIADRKTFSICGNNPYAKDKYRVYYNGFRVNCSDIDSFVVIYEPEYQLDIGYDKDSFFDKGDVFLKEENEQLKIRLSLYLKDLTINSWTKIDDFYNKQQSK